MSTEVTLDLTLVTGERKVLTVPSYTGSVGAALDRLHDWIETEDGSWVQKRFVVDVQPRSAPVERAPRTASTGELAALDEAVDEMFSHRGDEWPHRDE